MEEVKEGWRRSEKGRRSWADKTAEKMRGDEWGRRRNKQGKREGQRI